jgi:uncharacterized membrane protein
MTIIANKNAIPGEYEITIQALGGDGKRRNCTFNLIVTNIDYEKFVS